jgi:hypothetical protein
VLSKAAIIRKEIGRDAKKSRVAQLFQRADRDDDHADKADAPSWSSTGKL